MNARFANKGLVKPVDYNTLDALMKFYENGGQVTKVKSAKRPKRGYTVGKESQIVKG